MKGDLEGFRVRQAIVSEVYVKRSRATEFQEM